jgi:sortase B
MVRRKPIKPVSIFDPLEESKDKPAEPTKTVKVNKAEKKSKLLFRLTVFLSTVTGLLIIFIISAFISQWTDLIQARDVNKNLIAEKEKLEDEMPEGGETGGKGGKKAETFDTAMADINPDYICWLKIEGTAVDFPVVRSDDNEKYLNLTFYGQENVYGSIFMDYRCAGTNVPHILIYGHNTKDGDMFGSLRDFLNKDYRAKHKIISLTINNRVNEYEIFDARMTDVDDPAYNLSFNGPEAFPAFAEECGADEDAKQIITLSTCVSGNDKDERVIVQGALIS